MTTRSGSAGAWWGLPSATIASCSSRRVSGSSGRNEATSGPITPASTTDAICGAAQLVVGADAAIRGPVSAGTAACAAEVSASKATTATRGDIPAHAAHPWTIGRFRRALDRRPVDMNEIRTISRLGASTRYGRGVRRGLALLLGLAVLARRRVDRRGGPCGPEADRGHDARRQAALARRPPRQAGGDQRLVVVVKHVQQRGGRLRTLGRKAGGSGFTSSA